MADVDPDSWASSPGRRRNMQANRSRDTGPELAVRRRLHAAGLRYRVTTRPVASLRRKADIIFTKKKIAIFIDGCFWHGCPEHGSRKWQHNVDYWPDKIARNRARDIETTKILTESGWQVLRFWEHEDAESVAATVIGAVRERQQAP